MEKSTNIVEQFDGSTLCEVNERFTQSRPTKHVISTINQSKQENLHVMYVTSNSDILQYYVNVKELMLLSVVLGAIHVEADFEQHGSYVNIVLFILVNVHLSVKYVATDIV